jgi:hypothetical protein
VVAAQAGSTAWTGTETAFQAALTVPYWTELALKRFAAARSEASRTLAYRHVEVLVSNAL